MATATLTTLTPVHVGSGQTLKKGFDFIQEGSWIGIIDIAKVVALIGEASIPQLSAAIEKGEPLGDFLKKGRGFKDQSLEKLSHRISKAVGISNSTTELKEQYRVALKGPCIPGSSIKGAIKTALFNEATTDSFLTSLQPGDLKNRRGKWDDETVEKKIFGPNANEKTTRFLKVGDAHFNDLQTEIREVGIYNAYRNNWDFKKGNSFLAEVIPANAPAVFEIKIDALLWERNKERYPEKWNTLSSAFIDENSSRLCQLINAFTKTTLAWEIEDLEGSGFDGSAEGEAMLDGLDEIYKQVTALAVEAREAIFRIGGNSGWRFTTGGWVTKQALAINDQDYMQLRRAVQKRDYSGMELWPKTRKMTTGGTPLGFVKISF